MGLFPGGPYHANTGKKESLDFRSAKIIVFSGEDEEYFKFISKEAYC
jgi:hypothetical protein